MLAGQKPGRTPEYDNVARCTALSFHALERRLAVVEHLGQLEHKSTYSTDHAGQSEELAAGFFASDESMGCRHREWMGSQSTAHPIVV